MIKQSFQVWLPMLAFGIGIFCFCSSGIGADGVDTGVPAASGKGAPGNKGESEFDRIRRVHGENASKLFEGVLQSKKIAPLQGAFAHLWLNRDLKEGNRLLREAYLAIIKNEGGTDVMTAKIAGS
jgi:hypothetical protein